MEVEYSILKEIFRDISNGVAQLRIRKIERAWKKLLSYDTASDDINYHNFLRNLYSDKQLLEYGKHKYACAFIPAHESQVNNPDSILGINDKGYIETSLIGDREYRETVINYQNISGRQHRDGRTFCLTSLSSKSKKPLKLCTWNSTYFKVLETCDFLKLESQVAWFENHKNLKNDWPTALHLRAKLHRKVKDPLFDGRNRAAGLAISTLICYKSGDGFKLLLRLRSNKKAIVNRSGTYHVVPAGMFQPSEIDLFEPYSIKENIYREYAEEMFRLSPPEGSMKVDWYNDTEPVKKLKEYLSKSDSGIFLSGVAVNLQNLRPEILTLMILTDEDWGKKELPLTKGNWEYDGQGTEIPLLRLREYGHFDYFSPTKMVVPGAAALWKGGELARTIVGGGIWQ
jgi:hypothetical protein